MTYLVENSSWDSVLQYENTTLALGGTNQPMNTPLQALVNRTVFLKNDGFNVVGQAQNYANNAYTYSINARNFSISAQNSADQAAAYAGLAQATNPLQALMVNSATVTSDQTLSNGYNAVSAGPIDIISGVTVTIQETATWSIV